MQEEVLSFNEATAGQLLPSFVEVNESGEQVEITPLQKIKFAAEKFGLELNDPNPSCKRCFGRGYTSIDSKTKVPVSCTCLLPKQLKDMNRNFIPENRRTRRLIEKHSKMKDKAKV